MRFNFTAALAGVLMLCGTAAAAQSAAYDAYQRYSSSTDEAIDAIEAANEDGDKYAGCRALERTMQNARSTANAIVDLMAEIRADGSLDESQRASLLQTYSDEWDQYDDLARMASNDLDACAGLAY